MPDRDLDQWKREVDQDMSVIDFQLEEMERAESDEDRAKHLAIALKECRRLTSDLYRIGSEVYGIDKALIDSQGSL